MTVCAVKSCKNYTTKKKMCLKITFHKFPTDPKAANRWTEIIRHTRNESCWKPKEKTSICSAHFRTADIYTTKAGRRRIRSGAVPTKALFISSIMSDDDDQDNLNDDDNVLTNANKEQDPSVYNPSTSSGDIQKTNQVTESYQDEQVIWSSDLDSVYDSPSKAKLKVDLRRKTALQVKHTKKMKLLQQKIRRLKKRNASLKKTICLLKTKRFIDGKNCVCGGVIKQKDQKGPCQAIRMVPNNVATH